MTREIDAPAVYLSKRFWRDFGAASVLTYGLAWFLTVPAAPIVAVVVGVISATQAQRPRVRDEVAWARAVLAKAEQRRIDEATSGGTGTGELAPPAGRSDASAERG